MITSTVRARFACIALGAMAVIPATTACAAIQQSIQSGAQRGTAEGALSVLGQMAIEEAAAVKLTGELDCTAEEMADGGIPIECRGQTEDGKTASVTGVVTSAEPDKAVVEGTFTLHFDGRKVAETDCIGMC